MLFLKNENSFSKLRNQGLYNCSNTEQFFIRSFAKAAKTSADEILSFYLILSIQEF